MLRPIRPLLGSSGKFGASPRSALEGHPVRPFLEFSNWLYGRCGKTREIALERLYDFGPDFLLRESALDPHAVHAAVAEDYWAHRSPRCLLGHVPPKRSGSPSVVVGRKRQESHGYVV
jgi:hypothetical protein